MDGFTKGGRKNAVYIMVSFIALYCWYTAYFHDLDASPVARLILSRGADNGVWGNTFIISTMASFAGCLLFVKKQNLPQRRPLWLAVHVLTFALIHLAPYMPSPVLIYIMAAASGLLLGAVINRVFYSVFFAINQIHPARIIALAYTFIQTYIHAYTILPIVEIPALYYAIEAGTLLICLIFSLRFDGNELEVRRLLPENRIKPADMLPILVYMLVMQSCFCVYDAYVWPQMQRGVWADTLQILPNAATLIVMFFFGKHLTIGRSLRVFLVFFTCGITAFLLLDNGPQRVFVDAFIQPAYLFSDLFYLWLIYSIFFTYGNKFLRLRAYLCVVLLSHFAANLLIDGIFEAVPPHVRYTAAVFPLIMLLFLLIPSIERFIAKAEKQRTYVEGQEGDSVLLPTQRPAILAKRDAILSALPQEPAFTAAERDVLAYLLDDHDLDTLSYFMNISVKEARQHVADIMRKCGADSRSALMQRLGALQGGGDSFDAIAGRYGLAQREKEVVSLLLKGLTLRQVAPEMGITFSTVSTYSKTIYRKLDINSRSELFMLFGRQPKREETSSQS